MYYIFFVFITDFCLRTTYYILHTNITMVDYKMYTTLDLDDVEKYEKDGCTWIIGKVRNSKDLYATKFRYIKHHCEGVDMVQRNDSNESFRWFPYAVNELKYIKGTREKYQTI